MKQRGKREGVLIQLLLILILSVLGGGCQSNHCLIEPHITYEPPSYFLERLPPAFPPLSEDEKKQDWGKELVIAISFAREMDLYRAITSFKRALILLPPDHPRRLFQIEYGIIQSYYLGRKYTDVIQTFENSSVKSASANFCALDDLLIMLYDSYIQINNEERANQILQLLKTRQEETAEKVQLSEAFLSADLTSLSLSAMSTEKCAEEVNTFVQTYNRYSKSPNKARILNGLLPGTGYLYVGQQQSALTSFLLNSLFIAAAYHFFDHGNIAAGILTMSLEAGWYFGGINGAGLAAREYNERLYEINAKETMLKCRLFPVLMLNYAF